jgi:hypothetical protein
MGPTWVKDPTSPGGTGRDRTRVRGGWVLQGRCPWTPSNLRVPSPLFPGGRPDPLPPRQIAAPHCARVCGFLALAPPSGASSRAEASLDSEDFQGQRDTRSTGSLGGPISLAIHIVYITHYIQRCIWIYTYIYVYIYIFIYASRLHSKWGRRKADPPLRSSNLQPSAAAKSTRPA